jgi:nicotinamide-nucleotide adenylyltransferase
MKAVFLGRFQPFHLGHHKVIEKYSKKYDLTLVIGSADKSRTEKNPLTVEEREKVIRECYPDIEIVYLDDTEKTEEGNREWMKKLDEQTEAGKIITQNSLVKKLSEKHSDMEIVEQDLFDEEIYSGTEIRRRIRSGEEWRYLVPDCSVELIDRLEEIIKKSGIQYEFEPGWKKENAFHGTADN